MSTQFLDCASFSVNYDIRGLVTVTYSIIHQSHMPTGISNSISAGGQTFTGYVMSRTTTPISGSTWYETVVTLIATTD